MQTIRTMAASAALALLAACGGSDADSAAALRAQADDAEAQATALAATGPCQADAQCAVLSFQDAFPSCTQHRDLPILAASATSAQAQQLAESQRSLAQQARTAPGVQWDFACAAYVEPLPRAVCRAGSCALDQAPL